MADLRTSTQNAYTNIPKGDYEVTGWNEVFAGSNRIDTYGLSADEFAPADGGYQADPVLTGRLSPEGTQTVMGSVLDSVNRAAPRGNEVEILNPQYLSGAIAGPYSAVNHPFENPATAWAGSWGKTLAKAGSASGVSAAAPYAKVTTSQTVFPQGAKAPTFAAPAYDEREVKKRASKLAAPGRAALEMKVNQAMSRYYENPNVRRMVLRDTLAGYGIGLANIQGQAEQTATQQYGAEHARLYGESVQAYNIAMQQFMSQARNVTTVSTVPTAAAFDKVFDSYTSAQSAFKPNSY